MLTVTQHDSLDRHKMTFTTAGDAEALVALLKLGTAWFDDLRLTRGTAAPRPPSSFVKFSKGIVLVRPAVGMDFSDATAWRFH